MAQMQQTRNQLQESQRVRPHDGNAYSNGNIGDLSALEQSELWRVFEEQREQIQALQEDNEVLQGQLSALGISPFGGAEELRDQLTMLLAKAKENESQVRWYQQQLEEERQEREILQQEREQLLAEVQHLRGLADAGGACGGGGGAAGDGLETLRALLGNGGNGYAVDSRDSRYQLVSELAQSYDNDWVDGVPLTPPFSRETCGGNVALSEDGYLATRTRGCRQSVLVGSAPLSMQAAGWYYELELRETVDGWVGGLGIGVTHTPASQLRRLPDKAWRIPHTFVVGYWGCVFLDGKERRTKFKVDDLPAGTRLGLLVAGDGSGDLLVFANNEVVVSAPGALAEYTDPSVPLYAVVDVFAATQGLELLPRSAPPPQPWTVAPGAALSPPPSPGNASHHRLER
eukprot:TRINITY_DN7996_c0_g7_i1.p1 TRINITY_DN7996_c0_g7~~TRINITY_DN7996_c0_g7_i1.p1  ORF type:complete len:437 (+),score=132.40 TRINITY_DN7996_c0_g7_i1:111-1313(+)